MKLLKIFKDILQQNLVSKILQLVKLRDFNLEYFMIRMPSYLLQFR